MGAHSDIWAALGMGNGTKKGIWRMPILTVSCSETAQETAQHDPCMNLSCDQQAIWLLAAATARSINMLIPITS